MINRPTKQSPPRFTRGYGCVRRLAAAFPVIYALGNHESTWESYKAYRKEYGDFRRALEKKGGIFLNNDSLSLGDEENPLFVSGLVLSKEQFTHHREKLLAPDLPYLEQRLGSPRPFQILLVHNPAYLSTYREWGADLVLAGHLHGGQARLPLLGGLIGPGFVFFPPYTKGLFREGNTRVIVSAGLGTHTIPFRLLNPLEVVMVDLVAAGP